MGTDLLIYSLLGGFIVRRYVPKMLVPLGAAVVGAFSNLHSWNSTMGAPYKPVYYGALFSALFASLPMLREPAISGTLTGSFFYSLYYASKNRGKILNAGEFKVF